VAAQGVKQGPRAIAPAIVLIGLVLLLLAPARAAAESEFFGIVQGPTLDDQDQQSMRLAHVHTDRFLLNWGWVQPDNENSFKWSQADRFIGELASHGIRTVPTLWGNPNWVPGNAATPPIASVTSAKAEQAWRNFLKRAVGRYGPGGSYWTDRYNQQFGAGAPRLPIQYWQVWNEPNLDKFFAPHPSPGRYAQLLKVSHDAITNNNSHARILLAGMTANGDISARDFLAQLYGFGVKDDFDAAALHPYARDIDRQKDVIQKFRGVMLAHSDKSTPLWLTELAWGSDPPDHFGINKGLDGQATMLKRSFELVLDHRKAWNVQRLFWYHWRDPFSTHATCSFCGSAGLLRHNRVKKPAYDRFADFAAETTPPQASITDGPADGAVTNDSTPAFSFASNEAGSTFECRFEGQPFSECSSPLTAGSPLSDDTHTFFVRAIDAPGNVSAAASRTFTVDTQPPTASITSGPANGSTSTNRSPTFRFTSNESGASFRCQLDGAGFEDCDSPFAASDLTNASHTFQVKATDRAGNEGSATSRTWTVNAPIHVTITSGPRNGDSTNDPTPRFSFDSNEAGSTFDCHVDTDPFQSCTSPFTGSTLPDGDHTFTVRATDADSHTDVASRNFTVDTAAPDVSIDGPRKVRTRRRKASAIFHLSASEHADFRCRIDSWHFRSCSSPYRTARLGHGLHRLKVKAADEAGNVGQKRKRFRIVGRHSSSVSLFANDRSDPRCHRVAATLVGTRHGDQLRGTRGRDVIVGFGGDDEIDGRGGDDLICGRHGDDDVRAGWGDDRVLGGPGSDHLRADAGRDLIRGGSGVDSCAGAFRARTFHCENGRWPQS
jgi:Glycosyl hydrolase catalytic core/RTX calcium-binding nonapeptide repeat (4 copies)